MKYRQMVMILGMAVSIFSYTGCTQKEDSTQVESTADEGENKAEQEEEILYGQVKEITEEKVSVQVGTQKEMEKPDEGEQPEEGEQPDQMSFLELTEEEKDITITDETTIVKGGWKPGNVDKDNIPEKGEKPSGESGEGEAPPESEEGGEKLEGEAPPENEEGGEKPEGGKAPEENTITWEDIQVGDEIAITLDANGNAEKITVLSMEMGEMGPSEGVENYEAANNYTEDSQVEGETLTSEKTDESTVYVDQGAEVNFSDVSIIRQSEDSTGGDNASFYGVGAAFLVTDGTATISDSRVETDADGGAGLFAYGDGVICAENTTITTKKDTSGGVHVAGGGVLYGWDLTAETNGISSAAVRSDRGGGTMILDGGSYVSNGQDSPAVYCTADIAIHDAQLISNNSEAVCIEGLNSLHLYDCDLTGNLPEDERNDNIWTVILYQSMSGDSQVGNSTFEMNGGSLTGKNGGMFYTTNTESTITLKDVDITYAAENDYFLKCTGNQNQRGWGEAGANGADCLFTAREQEMKGDVIWDSISTLDFYMLDGSSLTGGFVKDESCVNETGDGTCELTISEDSQWIVTKDSTLTTLNNAGQILDTQGRTVTVKGEDGTVYVEGDSEYTITVKEYTTDAQTDKGASGTDWTVYEQEMAAKV